MKNIIGKIINFIIVIIVFSSCKNDYSRVLKYDCCAMRDTIFATLKGHFFENKLVKKLLVSDIKISVNYKNRNDYKQFDTTDLSYYRNLVFFPKDTFFFTNKNGEFSINFIVSCFVNLKITKTGYRTVILKNLCSRVDALSNIEILLVKGYGIDSLDMNNVINEEEKYK